MMIRRTFVLSGLLSLLGLLVGKKSCRAREVGDLRRQLQSQLEPRTPAENAFLDRVVQFVEQDKLPLSLVLKMFQWARVRRPYPFPYFQRALTIQARKIGVVLSSQSTQPVAQ